jgi:hypothetical protein
MIKGDLYAPLHGSFTSIITIDLKFEKVKPTADFPLGAP